MAFRLSLPSTPNFQTLAPRQIHTCSLPPLGFQLKYSSNSRPSILCSKGALDAVQEEVVQSPASDSTSAPSSSSKLVLVIGGTGGVEFSAGFRSLDFCGLYRKYDYCNCGIATGKICEVISAGQLIVASLLNRNVKSRLLLRDTEKATALFGEQEEEKLQVFKGDTRNPGDLDPSIFEGITHVICCTGTTAFPSKRWEGDNTPEKVDWEGVRNLVSALPPSLKRIVLVSSVGVTKFNELPWSVMNLFGVLKYKKMGEDILRNSGLPFTIIRPGRLTDGPYTSYDLNTLLKATAGQRRAVLIGQGDTLVGEVSRLVVAEACIQALDIECTEGKIFEVNSVEGKGPGSDQQKWRELFKAAQAQ